MKYVISGDRAYVSIGGATTFVQKDCDPNFHEIVAAIRNEDVEEVKRLILVGEKKLGKLAVSRGKVKFDTTTLHPSFAKAYLYAAKAGKDAIELFFKNVAQNPNPESQADLANFLLRNALPITDRGTFLPCLPLRQRKLLRLAYWDYGQHDRKLRRNVPRRV